MGKNIEAWMHLKVDSGSDGFFITPRVSEYAKKKLEDISKVIETIGPFKVDQVVNNFIPMEDIIGDPCGYLKWNNYIHFLVDWAISRKDVSFSGMCPPSFDEWKDNENNSDDEDIEDLFSDYVCEAQDSGDSCSINRTEVGERLKAAREKMGIAKSVLAVMTGLAECIIERYESGDEFIDPYAVPCLSNELGISVRYLIFGDKMPKYAPVFFDYPMNYPRLMQGPQHKVLKFIDNIHRFHPDGVRLFGKTGTIESLNGINSIAVTDNIASFSVLRRDGTSWMNESQNLGEGEVIMALNQYLGSPRMKVITSTEIIPYIS